MAINTEGFQAGSTQVQAYLFGFTLAGVMLVFAHFLGRMLATRPADGRRGARRAWMGFLSITPLLLLGFVIGPRVQYGERAEGIIGLSPLAGALFLGVVNLAAYGLVAYVSYQYYDPELVDRRLLTKRQRRLGRQLDRVDRRIRSVGRQREREASADRRGRDRERRNEARRIRDEREDEVRERQRRSDAEARRRARRGRRQIAADTAAVRRSEQMWARLDRIRLRRVALIDATRDRIGELLARCRQELAEYAHSNVRARTDGAIPPCLQREEVSRIRVSASPRLVPQYAVLAAFFEEYDPVAQAAIAVGQDDPWQDRGRRPILSWDCESGSAVGAPDEGVETRSPQPPASSPEPQVSPVPLPPGPSQQGAPTAAEVGAGAGSGPAPTERAGPPDYRQPFMPPPPPSRR